MLHCKLYSSAGPLKGRTFPSFPVQSWARVTGTGCQFLVAAHHPALQKRSPAKALQGEILQEKMFFSRTTGHTAGGRSRL